MSGTGSNSPLQASIKKAVSGLVLHELEAALS